LLGPFLKYTKVVLPEIADNPAGVIAHHDSDLQ
jgi:hypothetical protein